MRIGFYYAICRCQHVPTLVGVVLFAIRRQQHLAVLPLALLPTARLWRSVHVSAGWTQLLLWRSIAPPSPPPPPPLFSLLESWEFTDFTWNIHPDAMQLRYGTL